MTLSFERRGSDTLANTITQGFQVPGEITFLADGRLLIVWRDDSNPAGNDIRGRIYNRDGSAAGDEFAITAAAGRESTPFAFALPGGGFVVAWTASSADPVDWNIAAQVFDADADPVGAEIAVHSASSLEQAWPSGAALADGGFVIAWHDFGADPAADATNSTVGVRAQRFDSAGATLGEPVEVNSSETGAQGNVTVVALADGGWLAVWDDFGPQSGIAAQRYAADGSRLGGEFLVSTETAGAQQNNAVAALAGGGFVVAWTGRSADGAASAVRARIYGADGAPQGAEFIVNAGTTGLQTFPAIAALASGGFVINWRDGDGRDGSGAGVRAQAFDALGIRIGGEFFVNTTTAGNQYVASAAAYGNEFAVAWTDHSGVGDASDSGVRFARFVAAPGTAGDDMLTGSVGADDMQGFDGNDSLSGLGGDDNLHGGNGNDTLEGGEGNDVLDSGSGLDTLRGGDGDDRLIVLAGPAGEVDSAEGGAGTDRLEANLSAAASAVTLSMAAGAAGGLDGWLGTEAGHALDFTGIEQLDLRLSGFADEVTGSGLADTLRGMGGDDVLAGAGGDDLLDGGEGSDRMAGGAGNDQYVVDTAADLVVEEDGAGIDGVTTTLERYTLGRHLENLTGSATDQHLVGNPLTNIILGGGGNDRLEDRWGGQDTLDGGAGDDSLYAERPVGSPANRPTLLGGAGSDEIRIKGGGADINGGEGDDRVILDQAAASVTLGGGNDVLKLTAGSSAAVNDFNASFDRLDFHALLGASLEGWDQTANPFTTNLARAESFSSGAYAQVLFRNGSGFNDFASFLFLDKVHFNSLSDSALGGFTTAATAAATTVSGTEAGETLYGTAGDNVMEGLGGADRIEGGFGADTLRGGEGNDHLNGQTGHDTLFGGAGNDHLVDDSGGGDTLNGDEGNDLIEAVRAYKMVKRVLNLNGGGGDDEIVYAQLTDVWGYAGNGFTLNIDGGEGADLVRLGARSGTATLTLGAGADTLRLAPETGGSITVTDFQAGAGGDQIDLAAYLTAKLSNWNQADNPFATGHLALAALSPTETALRVDLNGGGDSFALLATLKGSGPLGFTAGNFLGFDPGGGAVAAGPGFTGTAGDDVAVGTVGSESLAGLAGDDRLEGGLGADSLDGGEGHDRLSGGGGDDLLIGGGGDDVIEDLDGGNDVMDGGDGADRLVITRSAAGTPGATVFAGGGDGADRFDITSHSAASLTLDGGAGDDQFNFFKIEAAARLTLGEGRDTIRLEPEYFGPNTNQTQTEEIVVIDFQTGTGGDFLDLLDGIDYGVATSGTEISPFLFGGLRFVQDGSSALLQYSYSNTTYQTLFRFENRNVTDFTIDNFGFPIARSILVDQPGPYTHSGDTFGVPGMRIVADGATVTIGAGSKLQAALGTPSDISAAIAIQASGATVIIEAGASVLARPIWNPETVHTDETAILGSDHSDRIFNYGHTSGRIKLGAGDDYFYERVSIPSDTFNRVDMGSGDDTIEFDMNGRINLKSVGWNGGIGNDTLVFSGITRDANVELVNVIGIETLRLSGTASVSFGGRPLFIDTYLSLGLTLTVPAGPSPHFYRPYTASPWGTLHLEGGNFTTALQAPYASIVGTDAAERVILLNAPPPALGTVATAIPSISLGGGDDYLQWGVNQPRPGAADGGGGSDRLRVDQLLATASLSAFTSFETIEHFFSTAALPTLMSLTGIGGDAQRLLLDPAARNATLQLESLATPGLAVGAGGTRLSILESSTIASLSDRYLIDPEQIAALAQQVENRGSILGAVALGGGDDELTNHGSIGGAVSLGDGNDGFTGAAGGTVGGPVQGGGGDDVYTIGGAAFAIEENEGEGTDEVRTGLASYVLPANVEKLTATAPGAHVFRGNAGANAIAGNVGNDLLLLQDGGDDAALGSGGNDVFYFGSAFTGGDVADGGADRDVLVLQGNYDLALSATNMAGIESLSLQSGANTRWGDTANAFYDYDITMDDANTPAGVQLIVNGQSLRTGEDLTFDGLAETDGRFLVYAGHGVDDLTGGDGADAFFFEGQRWGADDKVDGGAGRDALVISGGSGMTHIEFAADALTSIESISLNNRFATDPTQKPSYELILNNGNVAAGATLIVNGSSIPGGQQVIIDGRGVHGGNLTLFAGGGHDVLTGGDGADLIVGGAGADSLTGGAGADTFRYDATSDSVGLADLIGDFQSGVDRIDLSRIDANANSDGNQAFSWIGSNAFSGVAGELRSYEADGYRWVAGDTDGDGDGDLVIVLQPGAPLAAGDFIL
ncbi:MAG TPA: M10 family metallopeptidase C-terminal domain-containing protein [Allosphingosinicella sp.]|jgi:Ca2+-binding RTX toxin-like protein